MKGVGIISNANVIYNRGADYISTKTAIDTDEEVKEWYKETGESKIVAPMAVDFQAGYPKYSKSIVEIATRCNEMIKYFEGFKTYKNQQINSKIDSMSRCRINVLVAEGFK